MNTKTRILRASLDLFNNEGEDGQGAIDIANVLDISPGNLYYHFKGKDAIIAALFADFEEEMTSILSGSDGQIHCVEDQWVFTYIILEEIWDFRFFYRNLGALLERYPDLARRFRRLLHVQRSSFQAIFEKLAEADALDLSGARADILAEQVAYILTFWLQQAAIEADLAQPAGGLIHKTVFQIMALTSPYLTEADTTLDTLSDRLKGVIPHG